MCDCDVYEEHERDPEWVGPKLNFDQWRRLNGAGVIAIHGNLNTAEEIEAAVNAAVAAMEAR